ncbi:MAG: aspartyl/asparaginyl beta-hydroxylase domain-containing protein [Alphaproteobacteria bacterium]|nr:MAG: aspartyl/asparaginyl beta-hydroxylase domain-containing protein [Alphaproteobacteria bacterium]
MLGLNLAVRIPVTFDVKKLQRDLALAEKFQMATHPLKYHNGAWSVLNLIYSGGKIHYTHDDAYGPRPGYGSEPPEKTPVLSECKYFNEILDSFDTEILMARLSALPPGGRVLQHYDPIESVDFGMMRLHIPIRTHPKVKFYLGYLRQNWREGELWYGDFTFPHKITNASPVNRVHLIIDFALSEKLLRYFPNNYLRYKEYRKKYRRLQRNFVWYEKKLQNTYDEIRKRISI